MTSDQKPYFSLKGKVWFLTPWLMLIPFFVFFYTSYDFASLVPYEIYKQPLAVNLTNYGKMNDSNNYDDTGKQLNKTQDREPIGIKKQLGIKLDIQNFTSKGTENNQNIPEVASPIASKNKNKYPSSTVLPKISRDEVNCSRVWVTSQASGRLGNVMCEYAHLLVLKLEYGVQVGLKPSMHSILSGTFPHLSVKLLPPKCQKDKTPSVLSWPQVQARIKQNNLPNPVVIGGYPCNASVLWPHRDTWRREFVFKQTYLDKASKVMNQIVNKWREHRRSKLAKANKLPKPTGPNLGSEMPNGSQTPVVVGVHVRRTDYSSYLRRTTGDTVLGKNYFIKAFDFFRRNYKDVLFIVTSDDRRWCQKLQAEDVFIAPKGTAKEDLALLSMSSHLIMSVGTYGFWAGALSHGKVAFPWKVGKKSEYFMTKNLNRLHSEEVVALST